MHVYEYCEYRDSDRLYHYSQTWHVFTYVCTYVGRTYCMYLHWKDILHVPTLEGHTACTYIGRTYCMYLHWKDILHVPTLEGHTACTYVGRTYCMYLHWKDILHVPTLEGHTACTYVGRTYCMYLHWKDILHVHTLEGHTVLHVPTLEGHTTLHVHTTDNRLLVSNSILHCKYVIICYTSTHEIIQYIALWIWAFYIGLYWPCVFSAVYKLYKLCKFTGAVYGIHCNVAMVTFLAQ